MPSPCNFHNGGSTPAIRFLLPSETLPLGLELELPRTPAHGTPCPTARMYSPEILRGDEFPRSPLLPAPERGVPHRHHEVTKTSTPRVGANFQALPLTGAARICDFYSPSTGASGLLPETFKAPPRVPKGRHSKNSVPLSGLIILRVIVNFGHSLCLY